MNMTEEITNKGALIEQLIDLAAQTAIVHHIPGRIRLKVNLPGLLLAKDLDASDLMKYFKGIQDARANVAARSIVINYDERVIDPAFWELLVNGKKDPELKRSVRQQLEELSKPLTK